MKTVGRPVVAPDSGPPTNTRGPSSERDGQPPPIAPWVSAIAVLLAGSLAGLAAGHLSSDDCVSVQIRQADGTISRSETCS